jgi:hypothetical protein
VRGLIALNDKKIDRSGGPQAIFLKADPRAGWASGVIAPQAFYIDLTAPHTNGR